MRYCVCSKDSIRNAALDRKLQLMTTIGNVKSAPTFNRTISLNLQIFCSLDLLTHFLPNLYLLLTLQNKLKIYQWIIHADSIRPKFIELCDHFLSPDIDVLAVQESKLQKTDKTPSIEGYATIRKNRNNILGGNLLLFIWMDIVFEKLQSFKRAGKEILSIHIKATKSTWLDL